VRPDAGEGGKEVVKVSMNVEEGKGANSDQLDPPMLDLLNSGRQARQGGTDEVSGGLPEGGGREGIAKRGRQGRHSIVGTNFLKKNQMRLGFFEDGVEAAKVGPFVGVEREDGEQRGHGLPVIPRERRTGTTAPVAESPTGIEGGESDGEVAAAGAALPAGTTASQAATTAPVAESPPGNEGVESEGVEETWVVLLATS
jgi:hypothetical protein